MQGPSRSFCGMLCALLIAACACRGGEVPFEPAFGPEAIDAANCKQIINGTESPAAQPMVLSALALKNGPVWKLERTQGHARKTIHYILALTSPVQVGTISVSMPDWDGFVSRTVSVGKAGVDTPKFDNEKDWDVLATNPPNAAWGFYTLPAGAKTRFFRVSEVRTEGTSFLEYWRFYKKRLHNFTPEATGIGERGPFCSHPSAVINGDLWQNAALDPDPTSKATKILRPPVSDVAPSWFILHWDQSRTINGIFLNSNAAKYKVYAYTGDPRNNPALASADDWARVD